MSLLEANQTNRPLREQHVKRIAGEILAGRWKFNGDTIKISTANDVLDGQHRLWAVIEAKMPIETLVVYGIERDAFATIDTIRAPRSGGDVLALAGVTQYRTIISQALVWLIRYRRGVLEDYRNPANRVENSDIEVAFGENKRIMKAAELCANLRGLANPAIMTFAFYIMVNRNAELAERMIATLRNPAGVPIDDPFFRLRSYFTQGYSGIYKDPLVSIALIIKAANAAHKGAHIKVLSWRQQGDNPEAFPKLEITG